MTALKKSSDTLFSRGDWFFLLSLLMLLWAFTSWLATKAPATYDIKLQPAGRATLAENTRPPAPFLATQGFPLTLAGILFTAGTCSRITWNLRHKPSSGK